mmetsp:Transcript_43450/g.50882  ORF Transcript_43450/g.50882 Transcript_43450/m.50882 type:complete len:154 (-) Transcript_43450:1793-2254(-)
MDPIGAGLLVIPIMAMNLFCVQVTATGTRTMIARIVKVIDDVQTNKAPIKAQADVVASVFAPAVMCLACATFGAWMIYGYKENHIMTEMFFQAFMCSISVLVVACPCVLGLVTPTAVMVRTGYERRMDYLLKEELFWKMHMLSIQSLLIKLGR